MRAQAAKKSSSGKSAKIAGANRSVPNQHLHQQESLNISRTPTLSQRPLDTAVLGECPNCVEDSRLRHRNFSEQAWTVLLLWNEVQTSAVDQAMCDNCYRELREILIERSAEMDSVAGQRGDSLIQLKSA